MPRYVTGQTSPTSVPALGGGINDATGTYGTISTATDYVSAWTPSRTLARAHGGYDSTGVTANSSLATPVMPVNVVQLGGNIGGTSAGGNSTASIYWQLATDNAGGNGYQESTATTTNSTATKKYTLAGASYESGGVNWDVVAGTTYYYGIHGASAGVFVFGRGGTGSIWVNGTASTTWAGNSFSAQIIWDTVPSAPTITSASINTSGQLSLGWNVGTDDGMHTNGTTWDDGSGTYITGYNIIYKSTDTTAWKVFKANLTSFTNTGGATRTVSGLTPDNGTFLAGKTYEFKIAGLNGTTNAVQTNYSLITAQTGERSASFTALAPGGVYNGSTWAPPVIKVYNGSTWVTPTTFQVYNGSTWRSLI